MKQDARETAGSPTLEKIRRVAERRQALWSKAPGLTPADKAEIAKLTSELEALWEQHRMALAGQRWGVDRRAEAAAAARKQHAA